MHLDRPRYGLVSLGGTIGRDSQRSCHTSWLAAVAHRYLPATSAQDLVDDIGVVLTHFGKSTMRTFSLAGSGGLHKGIARRNRQRCPNTLIFEGSERGPERCRT